MRWFNTAGPVKPAKHYCVPPLERIDLDEVLRLVRDEQYFVLHAPRQTGKTSALLALAEVLNGRGYRCLYVTVETARTARDDVQRAMRTVLDRSRTVTADDIAAVREKLIVDRVTHLDYLADKLREDRVRRVIEPMLSGTYRHTFTDRDVGYARDLGLLARDAPLRVAS